MDVRLSQSVPRCKHEIPENFRSSRVSEKSRLKLCIFKVASLVLTRPSVFVLPVFQARSQLNLTSSNWLHAPSNSKHCQTLSNSLSNSRFQTGDLTNSPLIRRDNFNVENWKELAEIEKHCKEYARNIQSTVCTQLQHSARRTVFYQDSIFEFTWKPRIWIKIWINGLVNRFETAFNPKATKRPRSNRHSLTVAGKIV